MSIIVRNSVLKFILLILISLGFSGCDFRKKNEVKILDNNKTIIKKFESDANYVFGDRILDKHSFSSYNADRLIFQIQSDGGIGEIDFLNNIESSLKEKGWVYKEKYKEAYIYCDKKNNQLELVSPVKLDTYSSAGEGQSLNQLVGYWNGGFIHSRQKRYVCNIDS